MLVWVKVLLFYKRRWRNFNGCYSVMADRIEEKFALAPLKQVYNTLLGSFPPDSELSPSCGATTRYDALERKNRIFFSFCSADRLRFCL